MLSGKGKVCLVRSSGKISIANYGPNPNLEVCCEILFSPSPVSFVSARSRFWSGIVQIFTTCSPALMIQGRFEGGRVRGPAYAGICLISTIYSSLYIYTIHIRV